MPTASCDECGWRREYAYPSWAARAQDRHQCPSAGHPFDCESCGAHRVYRYPSWALRAAQRHPCGRERPVHYLAAASEERWVAAVTAVYGRAGRTDEEWVDRWNEDPDLLNDLCRVLTGTPLVSVAQDRAARRRLDAEVAERRGGAA